MLDAFHYGVAPPNTHWDDPLFLLQGDLLHSSRQIRCTVLQAIAQPETATVEEALPIDPTVVHPAAEPQHTLSTMLSSLDRGLAGSPLPLRWLQRAQKWWCWRSEYLVQCPCRIHAAMYAVAILWLYIPIQTCSAVLAWAAYACMPALSNRRFIFEVFDEI